MNFNLYNQDVTKGKTTELSKEKAASKAVQRLQGSSSEKQTKPVETDSASAEQKPPRKRTNNGAKRKTHPECEIETVEVEPDSLEFNPELATYIGVCEVVRYEMIPTRFIKKIYKTCWLN